MLSHFYFRDQFGHVRRGSSQAAVLYLKAIRRSKTSVLPRRLCISLHRNKRIRLSARDAGPLSQHTEHVLNLAAAHVAPLLGRAIVLRYDFGNDHRGRADPPVLAQLHVGGLDSRVPPVVVDGHRGSVRQVRASQPDLSENLGDHSDPRCTTAWDAIHSSARVFAHGHERGTAAVRTVGRIFGELFPSCSRSGSWACRQVN